MFKKIFCRHKKLTAIGIYEHYNPYCTATYEPVYIICKCDKCGAEVEYEKNELQLLRHKNRAEVDVSAVVDSPLFYL